MSKINLKGLLNNYKLYIGVVIFVSLLSKLFNLNYNSPSSDEAVYVAIGNSILFKWNWAIYNTASWVGGHTYFYPVLTSVAHYYNGIAGSRMLNLFFLSLTTYITYLLANKLISRIFGGLFKKRINFASLSAAVIVSFSATSFYISRLATYDMPSFTLMILSIYYLVLSCDNKFDDQGKATNFFISSLFLSLSFAFKYISIIYMPLIVISSYYYVNRHFKKSLMHFWRFYFFLPLALSIFILSITQIQYLNTFINVQVNREHINLLSVLYSFYTNTYYILPFFVVGNFGLILKKHWKLITVEFVSIMTIILFHLVLSRTSALDKHSFLIIITTAIFGSIGVYELIRKKIWFYTISLLLVFYIPLNMHISDKYKYLWPNFYTAINYLEDNMKPDDRLLSENGASIILTTYKDLNPNSVVTFDWFEYKGLTNEEAYKKALVEGYFDFIELESTTYSKPEGYTSLNKLVMDNLDNNYDVVLENKDYRIYKRSF